MGNSCCKTKHDDCEEEDPVEEFKECPILTKHVKRFAAHQSKRIARVKPLLKQVDIRQRSDKDDDSPGTHLKRIIKPLDTMLRIPTNFKIEPLHFRREHLQSPLSNSYSIEEVIGEGGFGQVKMVKDKTTGEKKAVKIISKDNCQKTSDFSEEIEIIKTLDHPNVVRFYEFFQDSLHYYLITELCEGGDLLEKIQKLRSFPEPKAARVIRQVFSAMDYCHKKKIVHRDLKPENILFQTTTAESTVKIIDFGRSTILQATKKLVEKAGTIIYMAPEVVQEKEYNEKCDIWSAGIILYLLLCGRPPFLDKEKEETCKLIIAGVLKFEEPAWKRISQEAKTFITQLLSLDPESRPTAAEALKHPWVQKYRARLEVLSEQLRDSIINLRAFRTQMTFQKAVLAYISSQALSTAEEQRIKNAFDLLDDDRNGAITEEELLRGYALVYGSSAKSSDEVRRIMRRLDLNQNGAIDYNEFIMANLNLEEVFEKDKLEKVFQYFDFDNDGFISLQDLKHYFGELCPTEIIEKMLREADQDKDERVSIQEFYKMMQQYKTSRVLVFDN